MPMQTINEVSDLIGRGDSLSPSLRLTKYARIGGENEKCAAVDWFCEANPLLPSAASQSFAERIPDGKSFVMKLGGRLIINQAGGVLENAGLCVHRHFGYPYIPGSAVKGLARHAAWLDWIDEESEDKRLDIAKKIAMTFGYPTGESCPKKDHTKPCDEYLDNYLAENFPDLFGKNRKFASFAGTVSFLPAVPVGTAKLETDVLTCHHMKYYGGDSSYLQQTRGKALDNEKPNPQFFPTVAAGASFKFTIVPSRKSRKFDFDPAEFATLSLKNALEELGAGAKTAAGYGWFEADVEGERKLAERKEKAEREKCENQRLATLSPEELAAEEFETTLAGSTLEEKAGALKGKMAAIESLDENEQRSICILLKDKYKNIWQSDLTEAAKAEHQKEKKRAKNKGFKRVNAVKPVAEKLGMELP